MRRYAIVLLLLLAFAGGAQTTLPTSGAIAASVRTSNLDADATAFIDAVVADGTALNTTQRAAINQLVVDFKAAGSAWTKWITYYPVVGGTASAHKYNLKDPRDVDGAYRLTFTGTPVHSATGILWAVGSGGYANTHLNDNATSLNSFGLLYASRTQVGGMDELEMGSYGSSYMLINYQGNFYTMMHSAQVARGTSPYPVTTGIFDQQRASSTLIEYWRNGSLTVSYTDGSSGPINATPIYIGTPLPGTIASTSKECDGAGVHEAFTAAEEAAVNTAIKNFNTTLGR